MIKVGSKVKRIQAKEEWQLGTIGEVVNLIPYRKAQVLWTLQPRQNGTWKKISVRMWVKLDEIVETKNSIENQKTC